MGFQTSRCQGDRGLEEFSSTHGCGLMQISTTCGSYTWGYRQVKRLYTADMMHMQYTLEGVWEPLSGESCWMPSWRRRKQECNDNCQRRSSQFNFFCPKNTMHFGDVITTNFVFLCIITDLCDYMAIHFSVTCYRICSQCNRVHSSCFKVTFNMNVASQGHFDSHLYAYSVFHDNVQTAKIDKMSMMCIKHIQYLIALICINRI